MILDQIRLRGSPASYASLHTTIYIYTHTHTYIHNINMNTLSLFSGATHKNWTYPSKSKRWPFTVCLQKSSSLVKPFLLLQATHINFICPMRFDAFPLDTQVYLWVIKVHLCLYQYTQNKGSVKKAPSGLYYYNTLPTLSPISNSEKFPCFLGL